MKRRIKGSSRRLPQVTLRTPRRLVLAAKPIAVDHPKLPRPRLSCLAVREDLRLPTLVLSQETKRRALKLGLRFSFLLFTNLRPPAPDKVPRRRSQPETLHRSNPRQSYKALEKSNRQMRQNLRTR